HILRLLSVDAEPGVMANVKLRRPLRLELGQVPKVIAKPFRRAAVEPSPKRRLRDRHAATLGHSLIVIRDAGNHVNVGVDVINGGVLDYSSQGRRRRTATTVMIRMLRGAAEKKIGAQPCCAYSLSCFSRTFLVPKRILYSKRPIS